MSESVKVDISVRIDIENGGWVILQAPDPEVFENTAKSSATKGKKGMELVQAIIENANVKSAAFYNKDGRLHDAPDGTPAKQDWDEQGQLIHAAHYRGGRLKDALDGTPAVRNWNEQGKLISAVHYPDDHPPVMASRFKRNFI